MKRLTQLDSLRGLAALFVFFSHMSLTLSYFGNADKASINKNLLLHIVVQSPLRLFLTGHESVIFFFVLSGFVLSIPYYNSIKRENYSAFIVKRFFRIAIPYYVSLLVVLFCITIFSNSYVKGYSDWFHSLWSTPITLELLLKHFLLIGVYNTDSYNFVVWSLVHELRISLIFPILMLIVIRFDRNKVIVINFLFSIISYTVWKHSGIHEKTSIYATFYYIPMFIIGALLAKNYKELVSKINGLSRKKRLILFMATILLYTYPGIAEDIKVIHKYVVDEWLVIVGAVLFILIGLGDNSFNNFLSKKPLIFLGKISYSLYLYHSIVLFSLIYIIGDKVSVIIVFGVAIFLAIVLSTAAYYVVEKPSVRIGRRLANEFINQQHIKKKRVWRV